MDSQLTARYGELESWHWWFRGRQRLVETVLQSEIGPSAATFLTSLGSGPPSGLAWLSQWVRPGGTIVGVDCETYPQSTLAAIKFIVGSLEATPLESASSDVVLALDVLEHLDDDAAGLREAFRLLKPGGLLVITVPAMPSLWGQQDVISHHRRRYTEASLYQTFARSGLPPPKVTFFNTLLFPLIAGIRWTRAVLGRSRSGHSDFEDNRPGLVNDILATVLASERHALGKLPMPFGVSLLATLRKQQYLVPRRFLQQPELVAVP